LKIYSRFQQPLSIEPVDIETGLNILRDNFRRKLHALGIENKGLERTGEEIEGRMLYPKQILMNHDNDATQSVETTADQMTVGKSEQDSHAVEETDTVSVQIASAATLKGKAPVKRVDEIIPVPIQIAFSHERLKKYLPLFDGNLWISHNALCTVLGDTPEVPGFVNGYMKPLHYVAELADGKYVLIDTQEAEEILNRGILVKALHLVNQGALIGNSELPEEIERQARILNGDVRDMQDGLIKDIEEEILKNLKD